MFSVLPACLVTNDIHVQLRSGLNDVLHIWAVLIFRQTCVRHMTCQNNIWVQIYKKTSLCMLGCQNLFWLKKQKLSMMHLQHKQSIPNTLFIKCICEWLMDDDGWCLTLPTDMDLVPGAACTSMLLLFASSFSMSEAVVDIGVADLEPVKSDSSSCNNRGLIHGNEQIANPSQGSSWYSGRS